MPRRTVDPVYVPLTVTTPPGTLRTAPQSTAAAVPTGVLEVVDLLVPPGHSGATGLRLEMSGAAILPFSNPAAWIVADDLKELFTVDLEVDSRLVVVTYNEGQFPHSHYLRFRVRQLPRAVGLPSATLVDLTPSAN